MYYLATCERKTRRVLFRLAAFIVVIGLVPAFKALATGAIPPPDGMVANWSAEGNAVDSVSGIAGTLLNGVTYAPGMVGQGFNFNGVNSYISVANRAGLNLTNQYTVEFWFKDKGTTATGGGLVTKRITTKDQQVNYGTAIFPISANMVRLYINDPSVWYQYSQYSPAPPAGTFHHLAALFQQVDTSSALLSTYIDGILVYSSVVSGDLSKTTNTGPLYIGASSPTQEFFDGIIDEISIYRRALTPTEIQAIYAAGTAGKATIPTAPYAYVAPSNTVARVGDNPVLSVAAGGTAPIHYQWRFNGTNLPGATDYTYTITNIQASQSGNYELLMTNGAGSNLLSFTMTVPTFDQGQFEFGGWQEMSINYTKYKLAQTFIPTISGRLVEFAVSGDNTQGYPTILTITDVVDGHPGTNVLGRTQLDTLASDAQFLFTNNAVYLQSGTPYAAVFSTEAPASYFRTYMFKVALYNNYVWGSLLESIEPSGTWQDANYGDGEDLDFGTYMSPGIPPVWLSSPSGSSQFQSTDVIPIAASIAPSVNNALSVDFYSGTNLVGSVSQPPFTLFWTNAMAGAQVLTAVLNTSGGSSTSAAVQISVVSSQPANDRFDQRINLVGDYCVTAITNTLATLEPGEPRPNPFTTGQSVWWSWTAPRTAWVTLAVPGATGSNAFLAAYTGVSVTGLHPVTNGVQTCTFLASSGQVYQFAADSFSGSLSGSPLMVALSDLELTAPANGAVSTAPTVFNIQAGRTSTNRTLTSVDFFEGTNLVATLTNTPYTLTLPCPNPGYFPLRVRAWDAMGVSTLSQIITNIVRPANDNFSNAIVVSGYRTNIQTFNTAATMEPGEKKWAENVGGHSIWYRWTAPGSGPCTISQSGPFGLVVSVYTGDSLSHLSFVGGNAFGTTTTGPLLFQVMAGSNYCISLDGFYGEEGPLSWALTLQPPNDTFSNRVQIAGAEFSSPASVAGSSLESGESGLSSNPNAGSVWWTWTAAASAQTTISAVPSTTPVELMVFVGSTLTNLSLVTNSDPAWSTNALLTFQAQQGTAYQIVAIGDATQISSFTLDLNSQSLHFISPADLSTLQAPASLQLAVEKDNPGGSPVKMDYYANNLLIGSASNAPFTFDWTGVTAGTYTLLANSISTNGVTNSSAPVTILVYSNEDVPSPRVFSGTFSTRSFVVNTVGSVYVLGFPPSAAATGTNKFIHDSVIDGFHPQLANWSVDQNTRWVRIIDGWGLTSDGKIYREGVTNILPPAGVTRWMNLGNNGWAFGDDGQIYGGGTNLLTFGVSSIPWLDGGPGSDSIVTLAEDGRAFLQSAGSSTLISLPSGVTRWKSIGIATHFAVLLGDDGNLYRTISNPPSLVAFPSGVTNWSTFSVGGAHVMALGGDGQIYMWGRNAEGELGLGFTGADLQPWIKIPLPTGVTAWTSIAAGNAHCLAIGNDGALYAWGANDNGQLGLGPVYNQAVPMRVSGVGTLWAAPVISTSHDALRQPDGSFLIRFKTDLNRTYVIQYTDDGLHWKSSLPSIMGTGDYVDWTDNGPPKTETAPNNTSMRIYRVTFIH